MPNLMTIKQVGLTGNHRQPVRVGATIHAGGMTIPTPPFRALQIAQYPGEESCYLFHFSGQGEGTDTFHESLDEALAYAEQLYGVSRAEWTDVSFPFGSDEQ
jgi:hypothetical protein